MPVILTILGISALIFIHEFGHFICARLAGVRVHVFSLGFGPRIWGFRRGDTDYRLSAMPLGGYVQVAGDDPTYDRDLLASSDLHSKGFLARTLFYSGGVIMNLLFALVAFPIVFNSGVKFGAPVLGTVTDGWPAWEAGLQRGDKILSVNGKEMYSFNNLTVEIALARAKRGLVVVYERAGETRECNVFPRYSPHRGLRIIGAEQGLEPGPFAVSVHADGPAFGAGIRSGDVLLTADGKTIRTLDDWREWEPNFTPANPIKIRVRRPAKTGPQARESEELEFTFLPTQRAEGGTRIGIKPAAREVVGLRAGNAMLQALGLKREDRIRFTNGRPFRGGDLDLASANDTLTITVERPGVADMVELRAVVPADQRAALATDIALGSDVSDATIEIQRGSPSVRAGLQNGDLVTAVDGKAVENWEELSAAVGAADGKPITLAIVRTDGIVAIKIQPERGARLGFGPDVKRQQVLFQTHSFGESLQAGWVASMDFVKQVYVTLKRIFTGEVSTKNLGGIITISRVSYAFAKQGFALHLYFLAILSINLAVINILPIPVFDGGHLMFLLIERVKGSPVSTRIHNYSQILGLVFVLALLVYVTYNDILKAWF